VGDIVDIIRFGDDLGMTQGPFMDEEMLPAIVQTKA
jgi:uroporphyrinogen decarboxylase